MQSVTPTSQYLKALNEGSHQPDDVQKEAVSRLEIIYQELINSTPPAPRTSGLMARVGKLWGKREDTKHMPVRGLYMWGGVGRGKTWLMDLFYQTGRLQRRATYVFRQEADGQWRCAVDNSYGTDLLASVAASAEAAARDAQRAAGAVG